jgi:hypothetical protein
LDAQPALLSHRQFSLIHNRLASQEYAAVDARKTRDSLNEFQSLVGDRSFRYGVDVDKFNSRVADRTKRYNQLSSMAGTGQVAAGGISSQAGAVGSNINAAYQNLGAGQANAALAKGNAAAGGFAGINNAIQGGFQNYLGYQQMQNQNAFLQNLTNPAAITGTAGGGGPPPRIIDEYGAGAY